MPHQNLFILRKRFHSMQLPYPFCLLGPPSVPFSVNCTFTFSRHIEDMVLQLNGVCSCIEAWGGRLGKVLHQVIMHTLGRLDSSCPAQDCLTYFLLYMWTCSILLPLSMGGFEVIVQGVKAKVGKGAREVTNTMSWLVLSCTAVT